MLTHSDINRKTLVSLIRKRRITLAGNVKLKIYGELSCTSGKRMKKRNRVFFKDQNEAIDLGYRPCGNCMRAQYDHWKRKNGD